MRVRGESDRVGRGGGPRVSPEHCGAIAPPGQAARHRRQPRVHVFHVARQHSREPPRVGALPDALGIGVGAALLNGVPRQLGRH